MNSKQLFFVLNFFLLSAFSFSQPGRDGALTVTSSSQIVNHYAPVSGSIAAGSTTLTVTNTGTLLPLCPGNLIMIYQAQGASISFTNTINYGNITAYNSAGLYELKYVQSVTGNQVTVQTAFTNSYAAGKAQVIQVPQYTSLIINAGASIVPKPWKDTTISSTAYRFGGLVVIHAANIVNSGTISATGKGFRGGVLIQNTSYVNGTTDYVSGLLTHGGEKGEGIFGYQTDYDSNGGRYCRGAGANGGGGADATNASGGGGANGYNGNAWTGQGVMIVNANSPLSAWALDPGYAANSNALTNSSGGGRGGYSWSYALLSPSSVAPGSSSWLGDLRREVGGLGGRPLTNIDANTRIYFGGGGGAADGNDNAGSSGAGGGGIVYLIATGGISGSGVIESEGNTAANSIACGCDGVGGGGAGGSIVIKTGAIVNSQMITANGGKGGSKIPVNNPLLVNESEGPGGGGGGGFVAISTGVIIPSINGGINGTIISPPTTGQMEYNGGTQGAAGQTGTVSISFPTYTPPFAGSNSPVCAGSAINFSTVPNYTYTWSGPSGFNSSVQNPTLTNATLLMAGIYTLSLTQPVCFLPITQTLQVIVNNVSLSVANASACPNATATLTASGASSYTWLATGQSGSSFTDNPSVTTVYTVTGLSASGCTANATGTIFVNAIPSLTFIPTSISCASKGSATVNASGSHAPYNYTWFPSAQTGTTASNLVPGIYTLTINDASGCNFTTTTTFTSATSYTGTVSSGSVACFGNSTGSASIAVSGGSGSQTYTWTNPPGVQTTTVASALSVGAHTVTVKDALTACILTQTFQVNGPAALSLNASASSPTACTGNSLTLTGNASGGTPGYSYTWTSGPPTSTWSVSKATGGAYAYSLTCQDANSCSVSTVVSVSFVSTPTLSVANPTICLGGTATLSATGAGTYTWYPSLSTGSLLTVSPSATSVYTVNGGSLGCFSNTLVSVAVLQPPVLSFTPANITCASLGSATVNASGTGPYSYSWTPTAQTTSIATGLYPGSYTMTVLDNGTGCISMSTTSFAPVTPFTGTVSSTSSLSCNGASSGTANISLSGGSGTQSYSWTNAPAAIQTNPIASSLYGGVHTVTVTDALTFCKVIESFTITQPSAITLTITASSPTACTGYSITLAVNALGGTPGYTYSWTPGSTGFTNTVSQASSGNFNYSVTVSDSHGCLAAKSTTISFISTPTLAVSNTTICLNTVASLSVSGATTYTWAPGSLPGATFTTSPAVSSVYTVTGNYLGCTAITTASVLVNPLPVASIVVSPTVCSNQTILFTASGGSSYVWTGAGSFASTLQNPAATPKAGLYHVTVTSAEGCTASASASISVLQAPIPIVTGASVCLGEPAVLTATGGANYQWSGPGGYSSTLASITIPTVSANMTGNYSVVVTGTNGCSSFSVVSLTGNPFPLPTPSISANPVACLNAEISLKGEGGTSYQWSGPNAFSSNLQNVSLTVKGFNMTGTYTLSVRNASNCASSTTVLVTVYPQPKGSLLSSNLNFCVPACQDFKFKAAVNIAPVVSRTFQVNGFRLNDSLPNYCFSSKGAYTGSVMFRDTNGCVNKATLVLNAYEKPQAGFEFYPANPLVSTDPVIFTNTSSGASQTDWKWVFGDNSRDSSSTKDAQHVFENMGSYPVALLVKNQWGCADTIVRLLSIGEDFRLYVPNAFTPNGDYINDTFQPKGISMKSYELRIFDRWGLQLFYTKYFETGWNGTYNGSDCTDDVYVWKIDAVLPGGLSRSFSGYVSLIR